MSQSVSAFLYSLRIFSNTLVNQLVAFHVRTLQYLPKHVMRMRTMEYLYPNERNHTTIERNQTEFHLNQVNAP